MGSRLSCSTTRRIVLTVAASVKLAASQFKGMPASTSIATQKVPRFSDSGSHSNRAEWIPLLGIPTAVSSGQGNTRRIRRSIAGLSRSLP